PGLRICGLRLNFAPYSPELWAAQRQDAQGRVAGRAYLVAQGHTVVAAVVVGLSLLTPHNEVGNPLWLVDLDVVPAAVRQVQRAVGEQLGEAAGHPRVEVAVAGTEDSRDRPGEAAHVADTPPVVERRREQVVIVTPERRAGGQRLLIQLRNERVPHRGVGD